MSIVLDDDQRLVVEARSNDSLSSVVGRFGRSLLERTHGHVWTEGRDWECSNTEEELAQVILYVSEAQDRKDRED